ncbi:MAG TPA: hypothetical protein GXX48_10745, partial [Ochrobactrum intermedium]
MKKTLIIVGNAPLPRDLSAEVDAADFVVRFNEPKQSIGMSGTRTDLLMLATSSKPMQRRLRDPGFVQTPTFKAAKEVMLAYHPSIIRKYHPRPNFLSRLKGRRGDWTMQTIEVVGSAGKEIRIMPPQFYLAGCKELGVTEENISKVFPSTGFFGIWYMLEKCPQESWDVKICGFTWEGWKRHTWGDERSW